jgi:hypothetical protein
VSCRLTSSWLVAAFAALGGRILTFAYFIPAMVGLLERADSRRPTRGRMSMT